MSTVPTLTRLSKTESRMIQHLHDTMSLEIEDSSESVTQAVTPNVSAVINNTITVLTQN